MTERPTNEEREALIAGDRVGALEPDEAAELTLLADLLADPSTWAEPNAGLEDAIVRAVADAEPTPTTAATPMATEQHRRAGPRRRRVVVWAAAAVAAAAITVATVVTVTGGGGTSPDYRAALGATSAAPAAKATVDITDTAAGFRINLDARGLPQLPPGEYYQAWLTNAAGTLVPIGTFSSSDGHVTLWSGVSPKDFPTMTVTIESADNDQASSGRRVLAGHVRAG